MTTEKTVFSKAIHGAKWITIGMVIQRIINIITLVTLARILSPDIYGIMIATTIIVGGINVISNPGFGTLIIQKKGNLEKYLNPAWTFEIMKGLLWFVLLAASSPLIAKFFHIEGYELVITFGGVYLLITSLNNIGAVLLMKELKFGKMFIQQFVQQIAYLVVAISWAIISPTVWALVAGNLAQYLASMIATYFIHPYRPKLDFHLKPFIKLFKKTKWIMGTNILKYISGILDTVLLGNLLGPGNMAIYSKSRDIAIMPSGYIYQLTNKAGFAGIAKVQDDKNKVRDGFFKMFDITILISIPFLFILLFESNRLVPLLLGDQWIAMVEPLKLLAIAMTIEGFINITTPIFYGVGEFNMRFKTTLVQLVSLAILLLLLIPPYGLNGAAYGVMASFGIVLIYSFAKLIPLIKLNIFKTLPSIFITLLSALIPIAIIYPFYSTLQGIHAAIYLAILSGLGLIYLAFVMLIGHITKRGPSQTILRTMLVFKRRETSN